MADAAQKPAGSGDLQAVTYSYSALERVVLGQPAAKTVAAEIDRLNRRRVFVVTTRSVAASAPFGAIVDALGERFVGSYGEVTAHGPRACVVAGAAAARRAKPDILLAIGGGSAIDAAKLMLLCLRRGITQAAELDAHRGFSTPDPSVRPADEASWLRMIAVPTTLSSAEFTWFGGAYDPAQRVKEPYGYPMMMPQSIILDPAITLSTPLSLFLSTGMKAIDHAAERLASLVIEPFTEAISIQALRLLARGLPRVRDNQADLQARLDCQMGMAIAMAGPGAGVGVGASHAIGHVLGGHSGVAHGNTSCVLLPSVMRWNRSANEARQKSISEGLGRPGLDAGTALAELVERLQLPRRLREVGIRREDFPTIAEKVMHDFTIRSNPRPVTVPGEVIDILELAW
jgi:maleylacetate reductase